MLTHNLLGSVLSCLIQTLLHAIVEGHAGGPSKCEDDKYFDYVSRLESSAGGCPQAATLFPLSFVLIVHFDFSRAFEDGKLSITATSTVIAP